MSQCRIYRPGFRFRLAHLVLFAVVTGCHRESFRGEAGSGYKLGIAVAPAVVLAAIMAALLGYFVWRRISK